MARLAATSAHHALSHGMLSLLKTSADNDAIRLTERQRQTLIQMAARLRLPPRTFVYRESGPAQWVFIVDTGVVKTYRDLPSGKSVVNSFLFSRDLFGLARNGHYVNCAKTVTRATLYRLAADELAALLKIDGELQFKFLARLTHEIRASQRRALLVSRRDAAGRLAMFLTWMTEHLEKPVAELQVIPLPMLRTDIAGFLGLSLESVSRASAELQERGLVRFESQHLVRILDGPKLARLAASV